MEKSDTIGKENTLTDVLAPQQIVEELDKYIIGQFEAKRSVPFSFLRRVSVTFRPFSLLPSCFLRESAFFSSVHLPFFTVIPSLCSFGSPCLNEYIYHEIPHFECQISLEGPTRRSLSPCHFFSRLLPERPLYRCCSGGDTIAFPTTDRCR